MENDCRNAGKKKIIYLIFWSMINFAKIFYFIIYKYIIKLIYETRLSSDGVILYCIGLLNNIIKLLL